MTSLRFSIKEMKSLLDEVGELLENQTVSIHHCKSGHNNNRLYITNRGEVTLFYCHHCHKKGALSNSRARYKKHILTTVGEGKCYHHSRMYTTLPSDGITDPLKWPTTALKWAIKGRLSVTNMQDMGMVYSPRTKRVHVPITFKGKYVGNLARRVEEDNTAKYLANCDNIEEFNYVLWSNNPNKTVVLVEDVLSAYRLHLLGFNSCALMGTHIKPSLLNHISQHCNDFIIWLDNDNPEVKLAQAKLREQLSLFGNTRLIKTDKDPKEMKDNEILEMLNNA